MARSPFTLAAAVTAALPGAEVVGARPLTADGDGRFDAAVATLADGRELALRVADDDDGARELASEALALRALTDGARAMLPFRAPDYVGETRLGDARALAIGLLDGFQIEAAHIPAGAGAAVSIGAAISAVHMLPASVVRSAGLVARSSDDSRAEATSLVERAAETGRVPSPLTVRWREAVGDDELWRFESVVTLGGVQATSFLFRDDPETGPQVTGVVGWHAMSLDDPAVDLAWLSSAPDAADDVHAAYAEASGRGVDPALVVRARLRAELEFARWLVHGAALRRDDIVDDAAALLDALADGLDADELVLHHTEPETADSALAAAERIAQIDVTGVDTSMQTDAYNPDELWPGDTGEIADRVDDAAEEPAEGSTEDLGELRQLAREAAAAAAEAGDARNPAAPVPDAAGAGFDPNVTAPIGDGVAASAPAEAADALADEETQRAARAALQRWKSSSSE